MQQKKSMKALFYGVLVLFSLFMLFPFLWMVWNSFNSEQNIFRRPPAFLPDKLFQSDMFANYRRVLREFGFLRYTANSLLIAASSAFGQVCTCSMAGFAFARMKFRGSGLVYGLLLATFMIPVQVTIVPEYILIGKLGWPDSYWPLIVPSMLIGSFGTFMFREYFANLPASLLDSAAMDGAGPFRILWAVFFPLAQVPAATLFIVAFMNNWNDLLRAILYISEESLSTVTMGLSQFQSQYTAKWDLLLTGGVLSILPLMILYLLLQNFIVESHAGSGIKG